MPNTKTVRSFRASGVKKAAIGENSGGIPEAPLPENVNTTYPIYQLETDPAKTITDAASVAPKNPQYAEKIPSTIEPLGTVDLGPVNQKAK